MRTQTITFKSNQTVFAVLHGYVHEYRLTAVHSTDARGTVFHIALPNGQLRRDLIHSDHLHTEQDQAQTEAGHANPEQLTPMERHIRYENENKKLLGYNREELNQQRQGQQNSYDLFKQQALNIVAAQFPGTPDQTLETAAKALALWQDLRELKGWPNQNAFEQQMLADRTQTHTT